MYLPCTGSKPLLFFFFFLRFFWCGPFLKSSLNLLQYCFWCFFYVLVFGHKACWILAPWPGIELTPPAWEGKVLTTGPPGKSPNTFLFWGALSPYKFRWHQGASMGPTPDWPKIPTSILESWGGSLQQRPPGCCPSDSLGHAPCSQPSLGLCCLLQVALQPPCPC